MRSRIWSKYKEEIIPEIMKLNNYKNIMQVPKVTKISLNMGLGALKDNVKLIEPLQKELSIIAGQKAVITRAKRAIAQFKIRENYPIGCRVTLRGDRMYCFLDRLINVALPRFRDFRGLSTNAFDGRGNYTVGVKEQIVFPEIDYDKVERVTGFNVTIVTNAKTDEEAFSLLKLFGFPFIKEGMNK